MSDYPREGKRIEVSREFFETYLDWLIEVWEHYDEPEYKFYVTISEKDGKTITFERWDLGSQDFNELWEAYQKIPVKD